MEIFRESLAILLVFTLLGVAVALVRRRSWQGRLPASVLESRGKLALTARHSIHLVRAGDRNLILALHPAGITFLGDFEPEVRPERETSPALASGVI
jgi:flagellar biogenesis protein FliO